MIEVRESFKLAIRPASAGALGGFLTTFGVALYLYIRLIIREKEYRETGDPAMFVRCIYDCGAPTSIIEVLLAPILLAFVIFLSLSFLFFVLYTILKPLKLSYYYEYINYLLYFCSAYYGIYILDKAFLYYMDPQNKLIIYIITMSIIGSLAIVFNFITKHKYER